VNNNQATTFKTSLAGAAFISSKGKVYRLFQDDDDPTLGNDFLLDDFETDEFDPKKSYAKNEITQNNINKKINAESKFESKLETKLESKLEPKFESKLEIEFAPEIKVNNVNRPNNKKLKIQVEDSPNQFADQLFNQLMRSNKSDINACEIKTSDVDEIESSGLGFEDEIYSDSSRRFRVISGDCESAVAELLALETPKPIINVPQNIPPQNLPFDEKIRRIRAVTGICTKFQPTVQEKIISNIDTIANKIFKSKLSVAKNNSPILNAESSQVNQKTFRQNKPAANCAKKNCDKTEIKLSSFRPLRNNTASDIVKIVLATKIPILDSEPDFFNTTPKTIPFKPNQKYNNAEKQIKKNNKNHEKQNKKPDRIIVTNNHETNFNNDNIENVDNNNNINSAENINNIDNINSAENIHNIDGVENVGEVDGVENINSVDNVDNVDNFDGIGVTDGVVNTEYIDNIIPFPVSSCECNINFDFVSGDIDAIDSGVILLRRELCGYEFPVWVDDYMGKVCGQVSDLGDRFIDFFNLGKRIIGVNGCFAGDGCSLTAVFAAVELALRGKRVLLIDANRRNPALADLLKIDGISKFEVVTLKNNLDFLPVFDNKITTNPNDNFCNDKSQSSNGGDYFESERNLFRFIGALSCDYDFILFDAGCIADVPFGECVSTWQNMLVNGIFLVVSKKNCQSVNFNNIANRLSEQQIELLGIMVCRE
jgi:hypothetical protein